MDHSLELIIEYMDETLPKAPQSDEVKAIHGEDNWQDLALLESVLLLNN